MVDLEAGNYSVEWYSVNTRETREAGDLTVENAMRTSFTVPSDDFGPAVLYLKQASR